MITLRPGSHAHQILTLLSVVGEFPYNSVYLLGNERTIKVLIHRLQEIQNFRFDKYGKSFTTKMLTISGKREMRTIRLYKGALPMIYELSPEAYKNYMGSFWQHKFPGDISHILRNHRVAEAVAMCMETGIEARPYILPKLQNNSILKLVPDNPVFYIARDIKKLDNCGLPKTSYTRLVGAIFYPQGCYAVYNTRSSVMKWHGMGEFKSYYNLIEICRMNAGLNALSSAILLGTDHNIALMTLNESDKSKTKDMRFDRIYRHIHFIPMNLDGKRLLRILTLSNWKNQMLDAIFPTELKCDRPGLIEYDAYDNGTYIYSHIDSDIARLLRLKQAIHGQKIAVEVLCLPWQVPFLKEYLGNLVILKQINMADLEEILCLSGGDVY